jgi:hypothetical protein
MTRLEGFHNWKTNSQKRSLDTSDVELFLSGLQTYDKPEKKFGVSLSAETKAELLTQLRKMNWTHWELARIARRIARAIGEENADSVRSQFSELATVADSPNEITMQDVDDFIIGTADPGQALRTN